MREAPTEGRQNHPTEEKVRGAGGKVRRKNGQEKRKNVKGNGRNGEAKVRREISRPERTVIHGGNAAERMCGSHTLKVKGVMKGKPRNRK